MNDATPRLDSHAVWSEGSLYPKLEMYPMSGIMWSQARAYAPFSLGGFNAPRPSYLSFDRHSRCAGTSQDTSKLNFASQG